MRRQFFLIALLVIGLASCKSKDAFNYNEKITDKDKAIAVDIEATEAKVAEYARAEQFDSVAIAGEKMEAIAQRNIDEINALKLPNAKGAAEFKAATIEYFSYIKSLYTGYKNLGKAPDAEARQAVVTELQKLVDKKSTVLANMQSAQRKYASDNGFKVQ